jgi:hypothetical protein
VGSSLVVLICFCMLGCAKSAIGSINTTYSPTGIAMALLNIVNQLSEEIGHLSYAGVSLMLVSAAYFPVVRPYLCGLPVCQGASTLGRGFVECG